MLRSSVSVTMLFLLAIVFPYMMIINKYAIDRKDVKNENY